KARSRKAGLGTGRESRGEAAAPVTEQAPRAQSVAVAPGAGPAPKPRGSLAAPMNNALCAGTNGLRPVRGQALRTGPQAFGNAAISSVFPGSASGISRPWA